jgi:hypothetical protein
MEDSYPGGFDRRRRDGSRNEPTVRGETKLHAMGFGVAIKAAMRPRVAASRHEKVPDIVGHPCRFFRQLSVVAAPRQEAIEQPGRQLVPEDCLDRRSADPVFPVL